MISPDADYTTSVSNTPKPEKSPLFGKRIVITRALHQAGELADLLCKRGAEALLYPCIAIAPPEDTASLDAAIEAAVRGEFDWLVLTSANTVTALAERLAALHHAPSALAHLKAAAVGESTAEAARQTLRLTITSLPEHFRAEALAHAIDFAPDERILLPQADVASPELADALVRRGANVHGVIAYRTVTGGGGAPVPTLLAQGEVDAITFASPSAVKNFIWRLVEEGGSTQDLTGVALACIGPTTLKKAQECGLSAAFSPSVSTIDCLVQSLEERFK